MKLLLALTAFALILTAACSTGDASTTCANPDNPPGPSVSPLAMPPEGTLLLARELPQSLFTLGGKCGETTALPKGEQTWLSPDGSTAIFIGGTANLTTGISLVDGDGTHALADWDRNAGFWPTIAWSNGKQLAYNRPGSSEEPAGVWMWDGQESRRVYKGAEAWPIGFTSEGDVVLSPAMKQLKVVDSNGSEIQTIEMPFDDFSTGYSISPDGTKLAVMSESDAGDGPPYSTGLWLYDFGAQEWTRLAEMGTSVSSTPGAGLFVSADASLAMKRKGTPPPSWSADGERLTYYRVFYTDTDQVYHSELWVHDFRSGKDQSVSENGWSGEWSPDGKYLAFQKSNPEAIGLLGPDGKIEVLGRDSGFVGTFAWSPDGRLMISTGHDLRLYDPESREAAELEYDGKPIGGIAAYHGAVQSSPSGRYFALATSYDSGGGPGFSYGNIQPGVYIIDTKSGDVTRVIDKSGVYVSGWLEE